ncbi:hypothetical protein D3C78_1450430 [compost metagenome]
MQLETKRLIIREFIAEDVKAVHQYASDERVTRYMFGGQIQRRKPLILFNVPSTCRGSILALVMSLRLS